MQNPCVIKGLETFQKLYSKHNKINDYKKIISNPHPYFNVPSDAIRAKQYNEIYKFKPTGCIGNS